MLYFFFFSPSSFFFLLLSSLHLFLNLLVQIPVEEATASHLHSSVPCILVFSFSSSLQCFAIYHPKPVHVLNLKRTWASVHANASTGSLGLKLSTLPHCICKLFSFVLHSREGKDAGCLEKFPNSHLILMTVGSKIPCSGDISTRML